MKFVVLLILTNECVLSFGSHFPAFENVLDTEIVSDEAREDIGHHIFKKSISTHPSYENSVNPEGAVQEPCRLSLPTIDLSSVSQDSYSNEVQELSNEVMPPRVPSTPYNIPFHNWTPYDLEYISQEPDFSGVSYNSYNMPYTYPNAVPTVRSLPPVSTRILESISEMTDNEDDFDMNNLSDDNYFPPYVRAVRSRDDDILKQLDKDAMIPNILPTMPYPYMRTASIPFYQAQQGISGQTGMFPPGLGTDCGLPFLLNCSPNIYHGSYKKNVNGGNLMYFAQPSYT